MTLGQLDKHSVSSEVHTTLQAAHGSLSEQGCSNLSALSICQVCLQIIQAYLLTIIRMRNFMY